MLKTQSSIPCAASIAACAILLLAGCDASEPPDAPVEYTAELSTQPTVEVAAKTVEAPEPPAKPNVIWILLDTCRAINLGAYGYDAVNGEQLILADESPEFSEACLNILADPTLGRKLADNGSHPGHIFNLGHGVTPESDPGILKQVVDLVHEEGRC